MADSHDQSHHNPGLDAFEELQNLVHTLHHHGVLRFVNEVVSANNAIAGALVDGLNKPGTLNAVQNLSVLMQALSSVPPETFSRVVFAMKEGMEAVGRQPPASEAQAPGLAGFYHLLNDESVWRAITPILNGLRAFAVSMEQPTPRPAPPFTGKPGSL